MQMLFVFFTKEDTICIATQTLLVEWQRRAPDLTPTIPTGSPLGELVLPAATLSKLAGCAKNHLSFSSTVHNSDKSKIHRSKSILTQTQKWVWSRRHQID